LAESEDEDEEGIKYNNKGQARGFSARKSKAKKARDEEMPRVGSERDKTIRTSRCNYSVGLLSEHHQSQPLHCQRSRFSVREMNAQTQERLPIKH
jgi:hypothetical protein